MMGQTRCIVLLLWVLIIGIVQTGHANYTKTPGEVKVGLLVPLTGPHAPMGQKLIQAAQRTLFGHPATEDLVLYPMDTHNNERLVADIQTLTPSALVGPVFSQEAAALKPAIKDIPLFTLSNDQSLVDGSIFVMGFAPQEEANQLITFSVEKGLRRFIALLPDNNYGHVLERSLKRDFEGNPLVTLEMILYPMDESTPEQITLWMQKIEAFSPEALFIPDASALSQKLLSTLQLMGDKQFRRIRLLGLSGWDHPSLQNNMGLRGLWFTSNMSKKGTRTIQESLVFDIISMIGTVHKKQDRHQFEKKDFLDPQGFLGSRGQFVLSADGSVKRSWVILAHTGQGARVMGG